jgi:protein-disulfide isomerase
LRRLLSFNYNDSIVKKVATGGIVQATLVVLLVVCAFLLGSLWTKVQILEKGGVVPQATPTPKAAGDVPKITKDDHIRGDRNARIALIEYSDLECPYCKSVHPTIKQVLDAYEGKVMWVYRHYPLSFHANAQKEAEATECANELGGNDVFWKYLDTIFERTTSNGSGFALENLVPLAVELGLPEDKFKNCLNSGTYTDHVNADMDGGSEAGVTGTPGNILLDTKTGKTRLVPGAVPLDTFKVAIDEMLK